MRVLWLAVILLPLLLMPAPALAQAGSVKFSTQPLTVSVALNSVAISGDAVVAVGESGQVVVWRGGSVAVMPVASSELLGVSCSGGICLAVGRGGVVAEIRLEDLAYSTYKPYQSDLSSVSLRGSAAAVVAGDRVLIYRLGGTVQRIVSLGVKVSMVNWIGENITAIGDRYIFSINPETGNVSRMAAYRTSVVSAHTVAGRLLVLTDKGLVDGNSTVPGQFRGMSPHDRGVILYDQQGVYLYDASDRSLRPLASLQDVRDVAAYGDGVVAVGTGGLMALVRDGDVSTLTAPAGEYVAAVGDGEGGAVIAMRDGRLLTYRGGFFRTHLVGDTPRAMAYVRGEIVILGSRGLWVFDGGSVRPFPIQLRASDFNDVAASKDYWVTLVGSEGRIVEISAGGDAMPVTATKNNLFAVAAGYAVGDRVAVMLGREPKLTTLDERMVDVDATSCGAVAVGEKGMIAHLTPTQVSKASAGSLKPTSVSVNPRGAYALIGGSKGELIIFDGYNATSLPTALPDEVRSIAWVDERTALVATSKGLYRLKEVAYPPPAVEIKAPKSVEVLQGGTKTIQVLIHSRNGFSGTVEIPVSMVGLDVYGVYLAYSPSKLLVNVQPFCPGSAVIVVRASMEAPEGSATLRIHIDNTKTVSIPVKVVRQASQPALPAPIPADIITVAVAGAAALTVVIIVRRVLTQKSRRM